MAECTLRAFTQADGDWLREWCSALNGEKDNVGYHFEAYGYNLNFHRRSHLGHVAEYWWNGVTVLG